MCTQTASRNVGWFAPDLMNASAFASTSLVDVPFKLGQEWRLFALATGYNLKDPLSHTRQSVFGGEAVMPISYLIPERIWLARFNNPMGNLHVRLRRRGWSGLSHNR